MLTCHICKKETNSFIHCPKYPGQMICQNHCQTCAYWAGKQTWTCLYYVKTNPRTKAEKTVEKFRSGLEKVDKKIALSKMTRPEEKKAKF